MALTKAPPLKATLKKPIPQDTIDKSREAILKLIASKKTTEK